jgi:hypothetical protein
MQQANIMCGDAGEPGTGPWNFSMAAGVMCAGKTFEPTVLQRSWALRADSICAEL